MNKKIKAPSSFFWAIRKRYRDAQICPKIGFGSNKKN